MKRVTMYTTPGCPYCNYAKDFLRQHQINFQEIDVSGDEKAAQKMFSLSKQMGVPQIWVDSTLIVGFDKNKLKAELNIL